MLLENGTNPKIVQFLLGHRSVKTTLEIYNNVTGNDYKYLQLLNKLFK